jgi:hypothetical protein
MSQSAGKMKIQACFGVNAIGPVISVIASDLGSDSGSEVDPPDLDPDFVPDDLFEAVCDLNFSSSTSFFGS